MRDMISIADTEVCLRAFPHKGGFHATIVTDQIMEEEQFAASEFETFVSGFRDPFSIGEATVTIKDVKFESRIRRYLKKVSSQ